MAPTATFASHVGKNKKITAKIGTQTPVESSAYTVVAHTPITRFSSIPCNKTRTTPPTGAYGHTQPTGLTAGLGAYFAHPAHVWKAKVTTLSTAVNWSYSLLNESEATVAACTSEAIYRTMVADLQAYGGGAWYMESAVQAHEQVHVDDWIATYNVHGAIFGNTTETLSLPYVNGSRENAEQAATAIQGLSAYTTARSKSATDAVAAWIPLKTHPAADTKTKPAEDNAKAAMITALDAKAATQTPPWTR